MHSENLHQLYGGEISDFLQVQNKSTSSVVSNTINNDSMLGDIYNSHVKPAGRVIVTNTPSNFSIEALIEREPDPLIQQLQNTLSKIATEFDLANNTQTNTNFKPEIKDQTSADIQQANNAVMKALEELKALGEI